MLKFDFTTLSMFAILTFCTSIYDDNCNQLNEGTFELFEDNVQIGNVYRKNGIQIETYHNDNNNTFEIVKYTNVGNCVFHIKSHEVKSDIDTITWSVAYKKMSANEFSFAAKPIYYNAVEYIYKGRIKKISATINNKEVRSSFSKLNIETD